MPGSELGEALGQVGVPCLELWGSGAESGAQSNGWVVSRALWSVCFQTPTSALCNLLVAAVVAWFEAVELCIAEQGWDFNQIKYSL